MVDGGNDVGDMKVGNDVSDKEFKVSEWGYRHQQCLILFFILTIAQSLRACMGVALVAMTDFEDDEYMKNVTNTESADNGSKINNFTQNINNTFKMPEDYKVEGFLNALMLTPPYPKFKWNKRIQDTILSSFFWGYMLLQVPGGQLAHRFGTRYLLTGAMMINCIVSICLPWAAYYGGWISTVLCRVLQGLSQACIVPGIHTFFGKWAPLHERGRMTALTYGGQALGPVLGLPLTGFIASSPMSWPGIFRFYGLLSGLVGGLLWWMGADTPAKHPKISAAERKYIEDGLGQTESGKKQIPVPWSRILRCRGMYAIIAAHIGQTWGQLTLYSEVPAFMDKVMGVNIKANGLLTALPFMVMFFTNFFFSWFTDMLIVKKILSVTNTRKFANSLGSLPASFGLIALAFVPKNIYVVESLLVIICAFKISSQLGFHVNHIDISPNFAGTMMSISNFISNLTGSLAPLVAGFILTDVTSEYLWRQVFCVAASLYFTSNLIYVVFGTAERADWNEPPEEKKDLDNLEAEPMLRKFDIKENGEKA